MTTNTQADQTAAQIREVEFDSPAEQARCDQDVMDLRDLFAFNRIPEADAARSVIVVLGFLTKAAVRLVDEGFDPDGAMADALGETAMAAAHLLGAAS